MSKIRIWLPFPRDWRAAGSRSGPPGTLARATGLMPFPRALAARRGALRFHTVRGRSGLSDTNSRCTPSPPGPARSSKAAPSAPHWRHCPDQEHLSSVPHGLAPGLSLFGRAEARICRRRLHNPRRVPLGALAAPELEGDDDLRDAAEQGEEPDPQQQERAARREPLLGGPEAEHELQDAGH